MAIKPIDYLSIEDMVEFEQTEELSPEFKKLFQSKIFGKDGIGETVGRQTFSVIKALLTATAADRTASSNSAPDI